MYYAVKNFTHFALVLVFLFLPEFRLSFLLLALRGVNGDWYDLIWFNGAETEYAEITYTINGKENKVLRYDTTDMDIIYNKNPEKEYSMKIYYYDSEGNWYE